MIMMMMMKYVTGIYDDICNPDNYGFTYYTLYIYMCVCVYVCIIRYIHITYLCAGVLKLFLVEFSRKPLFGGPKANCVQG